MIRRGNSAFPTFPQANLSRALTQGLYFAASFQTQRWINVFDNSAGNQNGTVVSSPWARANNFAGSGSAATIPDQTRYPSFGSSFTLAVMVRITDTSVTNSYIVERGNGTPQAAIIYGYVAHTVEFYGGGSFTGTDPRTGSQITVNDNNWHQIVYTYDGVTWTGYLDGLAIFSTARTFSLVTGVNTWWLGGADSGAVTKADIAGVFAWNRALTQAEVNEMWAQPARLWQHPKTATAPLPASMTVSAVTGAVTVASGTPNIQGGDQTIIMGLGGSVSVQSGTPAISGGATALTVFISKVNRGAYLVPGGYSQPMEGGGGGHGGTGAAGGGPVTIVSSQLGRATANFDLLVEDGSGYQPRASQTVVLSELGQTLFSGCLKAVTAEPLNGWSFSRIVYHCLATDKSSLCDNRDVIKTYPSGSDVQTMILDIVSNFLNGEGITTGGVNVSDTLDTAMPFTYDSVSAAFDRIAAYTGAQWWVDMNGVLNFCVIANAPASPFDISATSDNFRNFTSSESTQGYANKFYAVSNLIVLPSSAAGVNSAARTEDYTLVNIGGQAWQQAAFNAGLAPGYIITGLPIQQLISVKVNSTVYNVYSLADTPVGPAGWYYFGGITTAQVTFPNLVTLNPGDVVEVKYVPVFQNATVNTAAPLAGTCGSGIVEAVIQAPNIQYQDQLDTIAAAYQARNGSIPFVITFETDSPGLAVGQALPVDLPTFPGLSATTAYITQVSATCGSRNAHDLGQGSSFRWSIEATTTQNLGNWLNYFERIIAAGKFPLPLPRYEIAQIIIGPGASVTSGVVDGNPDQITNAGQIAKATIVAGTPPTGQDLLVDILVNGVSIFGSNPVLTIPAGSPANTVYTVTLFSSPALFVYTDQVITASVSYRVLSASVTAASNVSARVYWAY